MKLLIFNDAHIKASTPRSRIDDYPMAMWQKFKEISQIIEERNVDVILNGGDLFDTPDPSTSVVNSYLQLFTFWNIPIYSIVGSHDKFGYNNATLYRSGLGTLIAAGVVTLLDDTQRIGYNTQIAGVSHSYDLDEAPETDYYRKKINKDEYLIQICHGMIVNGPWGFGKHTNVKDIKTEADLCVCFPPDQLVNVGNKYLPIHTLPEKLIMDVGEYSKALPRVRNYNGQLVELITYGLSAFPLKATPNHPVKSVLREEVKCYRKNQNCRGKDYKYHAKPCTYCSHKPDFSQIVPKFRKIGKLKPGDFVVAAYNKTISNKTHLLISSYVHTEDFVKNVRNNTIQKVSKFIKSRCVPNNILITKGLMRFFGYYLAEGNIAYNLKSKNPSGIAFTFHKDEHAYHKDVLKLGKSIFGVTGKIYSSGVFYKGRPSKAITIAFHNTILGELFRVLFGTNAHNKEIHQDLMEVSSELQRALLIGWLRGDGTIRKQLKIKKIHCLSGTSVSRTLILQQREIAFRCGYIANVHISTTTLKGRQFFGYTLSFYGNQIVNLAKDVFGVHLKHTSQGVGQYRILPTGEILLPIKKVDVIPYIGKVYNFSVKRLPTYIINGVAVHNCAHYHPGFGPVQVGHTTIINIGSLGRTENVNRKFSPGVLFINTDVPGEESWEFIPLNVPDDVFITKEIEEEKVYEDISVFIKLLKERSNNFECGNLKELITTIGQESNYSKEIIEKAVEYIELKHKP